MMKEYENEYKEYLIENGYKEYTPKGSPSTVFDYVYRINYIIMNEKSKSWQDIVDNIEKLIQEYDKNGIKSQIGAKSHNSVINALKRFYEFLIYKEYI